MSVQKLRVLQIFNSSSVSGPEKLVFWNLARHQNFDARFVFLRESRKRDAALYVEEVARSLGLNVSSLDVGGRLDFSTIRALTELIVQSGADVVHAHDVKASIYAAWAMAKMRPRPLMVSTHHGVKGRPDLKSKFFEYIYSKFFLNKFDLNLCMSPEDYRSLLTRGVSESRLKIHVNGLDSSVASVSKSDGRNSGVPELTKSFSGATHATAPANALQVLFVGRLSREKNLAAILEAWSTLPALSAKLVIVGDGPERRQLEDDSKKRGSPNPIVFLGQKTPVEVYQELDKSSVLVSWSYSEGLPISMIEAGHAGVCVLSRNTGGISQLVDNQSGFLVDAEANDAHALAIVLEAALRAGPVELTKRGKAFRDKVASQFSGKRWVDDLEGFFVEAISRRAQNGA